MSKFSVKQPRSSGINNSERIAMILLLIVIVVGSFFVVKPLKNMVPKIEASFLNVKTWLQGRVQHKKEIGLKEHANSTKHSAMKQNINDVPIQFEFYSVLPNMQVNVPQPSEMNSKSSNAPKEKIKRMVIVDENELEHELSAAIKYSNREK